MSADALKKGTELKRGVYVIDEILGQGGFGITYRGRQKMIEHLYGMKPLQHPEMVAIKEFYIKGNCNREQDTRLVSVQSGQNLSRDDFEQLKKRLVKEAQNIAKIDHPNVVRVYDSFEENNTGYIVMEFLEGDNLQELMKRKKKLGMAEALDYLLPVARALEAIHRSFILHLDIKPSNIIITPDGVKLIDFGVSKNYSPQGGQATSIVRFPIVSHGYSPIEQYEASNLDTFQPTIDVYSFGATLYFCLAGRPPEISYERRDEDEPVELAKALPDLSEYYLHVIQRCMMKNRAQRYPDFTSLIMDLEDRVARIELLDKAGALEKSGEFENALACYRSLIELMPGAGFAGRGIRRCTEGMARHFTDEAEEAYDRKDYETAILFYRKLFDLDANPRFLRRILICETERAAILYREAEDLEGKGEWAAALTHYESLLGKPGLDEKILREKIEACHRKISEHQLAAEEQDNRRLLKRADDLHDKGEFAEALNHYRELAGKPGIEAGYVETQIKSCQAEIEKTDYEGLTSPVIKKAMPEPGPEEEHRITGEKAAAVAQPDPVTDRQVSARKEHPAITPMKVYYRQGVIILAVVLAVLAVLVGVYISRHKAFNEMTLALATADSLYMDGDYTQAATAYSKYRDKLTASQAYRLGRMHETGLGLDTNMSEAIRLYRIAADQGHDSSMLRLGLVYYYGLAEERDYHQAYQWLTKAADANMSEAMFQMGHMYYYGQGVEEDGPTSLEWHKLASSRGHDSATLTVGKMYYYGMDIDENKDSAFLYFQKGADKNEISSINYLTKMLAIGEGTSADLDKACLYAEKSALTYDPSGMYNLGVLYNKKRFSKYDPELAKSWLLLSAASGYQFAIDDLKSNFNTDAQFDPMLEEERFLHRVFKLKEKNSLDPDTVDYSRASGSFSDPRDDKVYKWVRLGQQIWMAQNLDVGIDFPGDKAQTNNYIIEKYCYDDLPANCEIYGGLYQWGEMMGYINREMERGICPPGWHIPSDNEWRMLADYLGGAYNAGGKLKEAGLTHWNSPNTGAAGDLFGFNALPAGFQNKGEGYGQLSKYAYFWSSSKLSEWDLGFDNAELHRVDSDRNYGQSVRCVKD